MEQVANLPAPALITFGAVLAVIFGVRYLGLWQGQQTAPANSPAAATVAAVIVDPTALNKATVAVEAHTAAVLRLCEVAARALEIEERKARAEEAMATEMDRIREELRIQREIRRDR